jgi:hypothetical protein
LREYSNTFTADQAQHGRFQSPESWNSALLRSQMISDFNKYTEKGFAPIYARESFENCWKQYHSLGVNGVMDDLHKKFLELPTEAPDE